MARCIYVDGKFWPWAEARVHAEDRGFQFGDAIYEVCEIQRHQIVDETRHLERLERSLAELKIPMPMARAALQRVIRETVRRNRVTDGLVYLQVSRGVAPRDFLFSGQNLKPTVVCLARSSSPKLAQRAEAGITVKSMPDVRWGRCDIKTVMLLPASLAKEAAKREGGGEAWFVDSDGYVTEGASSNAWIIDAKGNLVTRALDHAILPGVTRANVKDYARQAGFTLIERPFTIEEAQGAREAFTTSATGVVTPVIAIDGRTVGAGRPGAATLRLREMFHGAAELSAV